MRWLFEAVGWAGMLALLGAYAGRAGLRPVAYACLNLAGAAGVAAVCLYKEAWPALALEIAWALIAVRDLARARTRAP